MQSSHQSALLYGNYHPAVKNFCMVLSRGILALRNGAAVQNAVGTYIFCVGFAFASHVIFRSVLQSFDLITLQEIGCSMLYMSHPTTYD